MAMPLCAAAANGHTMCVTALVQAGARHHHLLSASAAETLRDVGKSLRDYAEDRINDDVFNTRYCQGMDALARSQPSTWRQGPAMLGMFAACVLAVHTARALRAGR